MSANLDQFNRDLDQLLGIHNGSATTIDPAIQPLAELLALDFEAESAPPANLRARWIARTKTISNIERKSFMKFLHTRPILALLIALLILLTLSGVAYAIGRSLGYVPGVGLVENNDGMRVLTEPVSMTRDDVTLTVTQFLVYEDHVQMTYEVSGISPENDGRFAADANTSLTAFCGGMNIGDYSNKHGDPAIRLPDGTLIERMDGFNSKYPENVFATTPVYITSIPAGITEMTVVFKCIVWARLGAAPENWEIPLKLKYAPPGTVIGEPVLEVAPSETSSVSNNGVTISLDKVVQQDDKIIFYCSIVADKTKNPFTRAYPALVRLIDSTGQSIYLADWRPPSILNSSDSTCELELRVPVAYGPYKLVFDEIIGYYGSEKVVASGNWELQWASPDQTGVTLLDSYQAILSTQNDSGVIASLEKVVKLDDGYLFYIHMTALEPRSDFRFIEPSVVSVIDSTGRKISLQLNGPQVHSASDETLWEFSTKEKIPRGPIQLMVEKAKAHYSYFNFDLPPAPDVLEQAIKEHSFIFDVGVDPQVDQKWTLNEEFEIGGYKGKVTSARAVEVDSRLLPFPELQLDASINRGYEFTIQSFDPAIRWHVGVFIDSSDAGFGDCIGGINGNYDSTTTHTVTCRGFQKGVLRAYINQISILMNHDWEIHWILPVQ